MKTIFIKALVLTGLVAAFSVQACGNFVSPQGAVWTNLCADGSPKKSVADNQPTQKDCGVFQDNNGIKLFNRCADGSLKKPVANAPQASKDCEPFVDNAGQKWAGVCADKSKKSDGVSNQASNTDTSKPQPEIRSRFTRSVVEGKLQFDQLAQTCRTTKKEQFCEAVKEYQAYVMRVGNDALR